MHGSWSGGKYKVICPLDTEAFCQAFCLAQTSLMQPYMLGAPLHLTWSCFAVPFWTHERISHLSGGRVTFHLFSIFFLSSSPGPSTPCLCAGLGCPRPLPAYANPKHLQEISLQHFGECSEEDQYVASCGHHSALTNFFQFLSLGQPWLVGPMLWASGGLVKRCLAEGVL